MASIQKRNKKYAVVYTYDDGKGNKKQKWESYDSYNEARVRKSQIESQQDSFAFLQFKNLYIRFYF